MAQFLLTDRDADLLAVSLHLPIVRTRTDAGIIVTIQPRDLTDESCNEKIEGGGDDSEGTCLDLFCHEAEGF